MTSVIALLLVLLLIGLTTYAGARDGAFFTLYALSRNLVAFLFAMTLAEPFAAFTVRHVGGGHMAYGYLVAIYFAVVFGGVFAGCRALKMAHIDPMVNIPRAFDSAVGIVSGLANGVVVTGALLILWSLMPFAKYLPGDYGTARVQAGLLDTGTAMLRFYDFAQARMGGGRPFLLEPEPVVTDPNGNGRPDEAGDEFADYNRNGQWDRGWLWRYQRHGTVLPDHIEHLVEGAEGG